MDDTDIIEKIIDSFSRFALGDIEFNIHTKPISSFILCSCFIDQLAAFRYNHPFNRNKDFYNEFIKEYIPQYIPYDLYKSLRCNLVHNYTIGEHLSITSDDIKVWAAPTQEAVLITAKSMYTDLRSAFTKLCNEFFTVGSESRVNAIARYREFNIISANRTEYKTYSKEEADLLIKYYTPIILGKEIKGNKLLRFDTYEPEGFNSFLISIFSEVPEDSPYMLDDVVNAICPESVESVLKRLYATQDDTHNS